MDQRVQKPDRLSPVFAALADPTRRAILEALRAGAATVSDLAAPFSMTLPGITKHLKVLESAGLITRTREAQKRPCHLRVEPMQEAEAWIAVCRHAGERRVDRQDAKPRIPRDNDLIIGQED